MHLPADVTWRREPRPQGLAYRFHHRELGLLGRLILTETPGGQTRVQAEVAGHPADPQTAARQTLLEPLTRDLLRYVETHAGQPPRRVYRPSLGPHPIFPRRRRPTT